METNNEDPDNCLGGPSLLRTNHESDEVVMTSATVTIGGTRPHDTNTHEKVMQVLSENENIETKEKIFVVRPPKEFVSDLDPDFLEIHYPDLSVWKSRFWRTKENQYFSSSFTILHAESKYKTIPASGFLITHVRHGDPSTSRHVRISPFENSIQNIE